MRVSTLVSVELLSQGSGRGDDAPGLLDWTVVCVCKSKATTVEGGFVHLKLKDHGYDLFTHPSGGILGPLKAHVSSVLPNFCSEFNKVDN